MVETLSVILQVASFRLFQRRVFKMAPIHLHFELSEWPEFTVIVRFWILAGLAVAFGLGLFYAEFLAAGGTGGGRRHGPDTWPARCPPEWFAGLPVLVAGLGRSGRAAARHLAEAGADVIACDDAPDLDTGELAAFGVKAHLGPAGPELLDGRALLVVAPGLPERHPLIQAALAGGIPVWSEVELAARVATMPLVGVTGTNGKTTTTELAAAMLTASGRHAVAAGNVGLPLIDAVLDRHPPDAVVVELSSFQLRFSWTLHLQAGAWLNFAPDHLDWHPDLAAYAEAKARVWANQGPDDWSLYGADDPVVTAQAADAPGTPVPFTGGRPAPAGSAWRPGSPCRGSPATRAACGGRPPCASRDATTWPTPSPPPGSPWPSAPTRPGWPGRWPPSGPGRTGWPPWEVRGSPS